MFIYFVLLLLLLRKCVIIVCWYVKRAEEFKSIMGAECYQTLFISKKEVAYDVIHEAIK